MPLETKTKSPKVRDILDRDQLLPKLHAIINVADKIAPHFLIPLHSITPGMPYVGVLLIYLSSLNYLKIDPFCLKKIFCKIGYYLRIVEFATKHIQVGCIG